MIVSVRPGFNHLADAILVPVETSVNPPTLFSTATESISRESTFLGMSHNQRRSELQA